MYKYIVFNVHKIHTNITPQTVNKIAFGKYNFKITLFALLLNYIETILSLVLTNKEFISAPE